MIHLAIWYVKSTFKIILKINQICYLLLFTDNFVVIYSSGLTCKYVCFAAYCNIDPVKYPETKHLDMLFILLHLVHNGIKIPIIEQCNTAM